jgi:hypothetical protein
VDGSDICLPQRKTGVMLCMNQIDFKCTVHLSLPCRHHPNTLTYSRVTQVRMFKVSSAEAILAFNCIEIKLLRLPAGARGRRSWKRAPAEAARAHVPRSPPPPPPPLATMPTPFFFLYVSYYFLLSNYSTFTASLIYSRKLLK